MHGPGQEASMDHACRSFLCGETGTCFAVNALSLAYVSRLVYPGGSDCNSDYKSRWEFEADMERKKMQARVWGFDEFAYFYSEEKHILAIMMANDTDIVVSFRGSVSNNFTNWFTDLQVRPVPFFSFGRVHRGFYEALDSVWKGLSDYIPTSETRRLRVTGHSLGAALAVLAGVRFAGEYRDNMVNSIYTYGQPRVGDDDFRNAFKRSYLEGRLYKFALSNDVVTVVPPYIKKVMEYVDVGRIQTLKTDGSIESREKTSEFRTMMNFLTGYFKRYQVEDVNEPPPDSKTSISQGEFNKVEQFVTHELSDLPIMLEEKPETKEPESKKANWLLEMVMELFIKLFIRWNPYAIRTHMMDAYIEKLRKSGDTVVRD